MNNLNYKDFINELLSLKDQEYLDFSSKLTSNNKEMIGIRIPKLRDIAKRIAKGNIENFIKAYEGNYYEETLVLGFVIGYSNSIDIYDKYLPLFVDNITDWAICDCSVSSLKLFKKNRDHFFYYVLDLLNSNKEFYIRFGIIILMKYYLIEEYANNVLNIVVNIKSDMYYVNMAIAWFLCEAFIKYPELVDKFINNKYLNAFVLNKTISKICDSYRVSKSEKSKLKKRRI